MDIQPAKTKTRKQLQPPRNHYGDNKMSAGKKKSNRNKPFEKLHLYLEQDHYEFATIALANAPYDWNKCSVVLSAWSKGYKENSFINLFLNKEQTTKIKNALQKIIDDMD